LTNEINTKHNELQHTSQLLTQFKDDLTVEYDSVRKLHESLEEKEQLIQDKDEELIVRVARLEAQCEQQEKIAIKYKQRCEKLEQLKEEEAANYNKLKMENDEMRNEIRELKTKLQIKDDEIKLLQQRKEEAEQSLQTQELLTTQTKELKDKIEVLDGEMRKKEEKIIELRETINRRDNEFEALLQKWEALKKENDGNQRKITKLEENITELNTKKNES